MSRGIIILDAGHGPHGNPYPIMEGKYEGTQNYRLSLHLKAALEARDFEVILTRPNLDDDPALDVRGHMAGENNAVLFLSLHSNAPGSATPPERYHAVRGSEVYYSLTDPIRNAEIARALNAAIVATMGTEDRGVKTRSFPDQPDVDYYSVIRNSVASGCRQAFIAEHGFHTNPEDAAFLTNEECLARLAEAEAEALAGIL